MFHQITASDEAAGHIAYLCACFTAQHSAENRTQQDRPLRLDAACAFDVLKAVACDDVADFVSDDAGEVLCTLTCAEAQVEVTIVNRGRLPARDRRQRSP